MSALDTVKACLLEADRRKPHLRIENLHASCFELLEDTLALAGTDWQFIGKTNMDGAGHRPAWFTPKMVSCRRPDGQLQNVLVTHLGMDAAWHVPTMRQVKVIVNSTANEPGPHEKGPAGLDSYEIDPAHYRWHNPPIPQRPGIVVAPMPPPAPQPPVGATGSLPGRDEMMAAGIWLDAWYASTEGLQRPQGLSKNGRPDWEGVGAWLFDVYLKARLSGSTVEQAKAKVMSAIRKAGPEWQSKHPGETP